MTTPVFPEHDFALLPTQNEAIEGFYDLMAELRATRPVAPIRFHGRIAWVLTRHADVVAGFRDEAFFSARAVQEANTFPVMGRNIMGMEGEEHRIKRALVSPYFRRKLMPDFMDAMLRPALPRADRRLRGPRPRRPRERVRQAAPARGDLPDARHPQRRRRVAQALGDGAHQLPMGSRRRPCSPRRSSPRTSARCSPIAGAHRGTTCCRRSPWRRSKASGSTTKRSSPSCGCSSRPAPTPRTWRSARCSSVCSRTPRCSRAVRKDPSLRDAAVDETLRWEGPTVLLPRMTTSGGAFGGETIPPHTVVLLGIGPANRDPAVFPDPDRFDVTRKTAGHIAFGHGNHFCLGSHLARAEMGRRPSMCCSSGLPEIELEEPPRIVRRRDARARRAARALPRDALNATGKDRACPTHRASASFSRR